MSWMMDELFCEAANNTQTMDWTFPFSCIKLKLPFSPTSLCLRFDLPVIIFLVHRVSFAFHNLPLSLWLSFLSILLLYCRFIRWALTSSAKQTPSYLNHFFINCHALTFSRFDIINFFIIRLRLNEDLISAYCQPSANTITWLLFLSKCKFYQC